MRKYMNLSVAIAHSIKALTDYGEEVDTGHWQGVPTEGKPDLVTREVIGMAWHAPMPQTLNELGRACVPNQPWADEHFAERVSRVPSNPGEAFRSWPWWSERAHEHTAASTERFMFTHTYQERIWPKHAGDPWYPDGEGSGTNIQRGIRYEYGDLDDVVQLLLDKPYTRQAYLPIFFPEDTGAVHKGRIPCTLGYQFLVRGEMIHCFYTIRSCDMVRHFRDDVYLAVHLTMWLLNELEIQDPAWEDVGMGDLYFNAHSFHWHKGDMQHVD